MNTHLCEKITIIYHATEIYLKNMVILIFSRTAQHYAEVAKLSMSCHVV